MTNSAKRKRQAVAGLHSETKKEFVFSITLSPLQIVSEAGQGMEHEGIGIKVKAGTPEKNVCIRSLIGHSP